MYMHTLLYMHLGLLRHVYNPRISTILCVIYISMLVLIDMNTSHSAHVHANVTYLYTPW